MNSSLRMIFAAALLLATPAMAAHAGSDEPQPASGAPTLVILVRHAEKAVGGPDPILSVTGEQRAIELARVLSDLPIDALYTSQYRRARLTLVPLAAAKQLPIETEPVEGDLALWATAFASRLLARHSGQTVVVAGHSNTTPLLARALGATEAPELSDADYDDLFWIVRTDEQTTLLHLHFGAHTE